MTVYYRVPKIWMQPWNFGQPLTADVKLTADDVLIWADMIYEVDLQDTIDSNDIPGQLISSAHVEQVVKNCTVVHWPHFLLKNSLKLWSYAKNFDHQPIEQCANFSINKKRIGRYLLIKILQWYGIKNFDYTWSGIGDRFDLTPILLHIDQLPKDLVQEPSLFRQHLLAPITNLDPKYVYIDQPSINESHVPHTTYVWAWNHCHGPMISGSATTLITESAEQEKWAIFTEKTLYAVCGLTFPIWVGGYGSADRWAEKGFDVFEDVINHDYQYCESLLERCVRAVADNRQILTDLDYARAQKLKNLHRLRRNRELLVPIFKTQYENFWRSAPEEMRAETAITDEINQLLIQNGFALLDNK